MNPWGYKSKICDHLKLCVATATHNFQVGENYLYLYNLNKLLCYFLLQIVLFEGQLLEL